MTDRAPPGAKLVGGVWLPAGEEHFAAWMRHSKRAREVEGKLTYQHHKIEAAIRSLAPERRRVCIDVGAHVGLWAMWLVRAFARVQSFEPVPALAALYPRNVEMARACLHEVALGRESGTVTIAVPRDMTGNAHILAPGEAATPRDGRGPVELCHERPLATLDSFGFTEVDLIKIDVEGTELAVVEGARETIQRWRPNLVVEQKGNEHHYGEPRNAALRRLRAWGMRPIEVLSGDWILGW